VLLVVRAESTPFDLAQKARDEFRDKNLLGVVLNQAERQSGYGYYAYYSEDAKHRSKKR
jgi:Mrp family chromosome partitioning ATPase